MQGGIEMERYTDGKAEAWAFRWIDYSQRNYIVTVWLHGFLTKNFNAVIDDFGNLVHAP